MRTFKFAKDAGRVTMALKLMSRVFSLFKFPMSSGRESRKVSATPSVSSRSQRQIHPGNLRSGLPLSCNVRSEKNIEANSKSNCSISLSSSFSISKRFRTPIPIHFYITDLGSMEIGTKIDL